MKRFVYARNAALSLFACYYLEVLLCSSLFLQISAYVFLKLNGFFSFTPWIDRESQSECGGAQSGMERRSGTFFDDKSFMRICELS